MDWIMKSAKGFLEPRADKEIDPGSASQTVEPKSEDEDNNSFPEVKISKEDVGTLKNLLKMFRAASPRDTMILTIGVIFTIIHGASYPIMALLIGSISETFIAQSQGAYFNSSYKVNKKSTTVPITVNNNNTNFDGIGKLENTPRSDNPFALIVDIFTYLGNLFGLSSTASEIMTDEEFADCANTFSWYFIGLAVVVYISGYMQTWCWESTADNQISVVRKNFIKQILRQESTWFEKHPAGLLIAKLTDDVERFREGIGYKFSLAVEYFSSFAIGAFFGFCTNPSLTLVFGISVPFIIGKILYLGRLFAGKAVNRQEKYGEAGSLCEEVIGEIRTVVAFGMEGVEDERYSEILDENYETAKKDYNAIGFGTSILYVIIYGSFAIAVMYASNQLLQNHISRQQVYTVFSCGTLAIVALCNILPYINEIAYAYGCSQSITKITKHKPSIDPYDVGGIKPHNFSGNIKFRDVMFSYPSRQDALVLRNFNLTLTPGAPIGILGRSGAGKSTIVNLLTRFYAPLSGSISCDNFMLQQINLEWIRENVGVVNSEPSFLNDTIYHNITCRKVSIKWVDVVRATKAAHCHRRIMNLPDKYKTVIGVGSRELPASLRQLIALARVLVQKPKVVILDEAWSHQTSKTRPKLMEILHERTRDCSLIMFSHHVSHLKMPGIIIHVLQDGEIVEVGPHDELLSNRSEVYFEMARSELRSIPKRPFTEEMEPIEEIEDDEESEDFVDDEDPEADGSIAGEDSEEDIKYPGLTNLMDNLGLSWTDPNVLLGIFGCIISGVAPSVAALVFCQLLITFSETGVELSTDAAFWTKVLFAIGIALGIGYWMRTVYINNIGEALSQHLRTNVYLTILRHKIPWYDDKTHAPERLYNMLSRHVPVFKVAIGGRLGVVISAIVSYITATVISFVIEWRLAVVIVAIVPVHIFIIYKETEIYEKIKLGIFDKMDLAYSIASEAVRDIRTIQAFSLQSTTLKKFTMASSVFQKKLKDESEHIGISFGLSEALPFVAFAAIFRVGAYMIISGSVESIDMFKIFIVLVFSTSTIGQVTAFIPDYVKAKLAYGYLYTFCDIQPNMDAFSITGVTPPIAGHITFKDVFFSYEKRLGTGVLRGVSFDVKPGTFLGILGQLGKSTILSLLLKFYECDYGQVLIDGISVQEFQRQHLRRNIGYVDQNPKLLNRSIRENLVYGYPGALNSEELQVLIEETIDSLFLKEFIAGLPMGYDTIVGPHGCNLTNGERQRIAIARAVIRDPKILLLDMPTSFVDPELEDSIALALKKIAVGRTCIVVTNHVRVMLKTDYVAFIRDGEIAEYGTHEELARNPNNAYSEFIHTAQQATRVTYPAQVNESQIVQH